ncbi:MAG: cysteine desulfurase [Synergistales bacterium]|nr:cysteine desulfurase [Bacteroidales bacterium]MDY6394669.1 cysteine desulfurase [Bacteroidales bacterium]MDY6403210.1 cysteine desulfurase [Bacteroidales bacterium]MDY6424734.1 cysteine desulfurase [Bacteroidales bacterium]MDY6435891.1 cysteine desulfurase [Synergistales bacterium]
MFDVDYIRKDFPLLDEKVRGKQNLIYFDNAASTQKPRCVIDALSNYYTHLNANVHRGVHWLSGKATDEFELARQRVQQFINAPHSEDIIFTRGTTESINLLAESLSKSFLSEDDEVIITEMEHHSNIVPWHIARDKYHFTLKYIPITDKGELNLDVFRQILSPKTKLVSLAHISNTLGTVNPIKEIISLCHKNKTMVIVDGAQSIAHLDIDVQDMDCDFYCFSGHKVYAPMGIGVLYGKKEYLEKMYPYQGGGEMIKEVSMEQTVFNDVPFRFEAGTPSVADTIGLGVALEYIKQIGMKDIIEYEDKLMDYATERLQAIEGVRIFGNSENKSSCISFLVEGIHHLDLGTMLDMQGVAIRTGHHCAEPVMRRYGIEGTDRISFALYNTIEEIDSFIICLKKAISMLK